LRYLDTSLLQENLIFPHAETVAARIL
jgi:hypothetical protein